MGVLLAMRPGWSHSQWVCCSPCFGSHLVETFVVSVPSWLLAVLIFHKNFPVGLEAGAGFCMSLLGVIFLVFSLEFLPGNLAFRTVSVWGLGYAKFAVLDIFAGSIIPLSLFPDWHRPVVMNLLFKDMTYTPLAIYTVRITGRAIWVSILGQFLRGIGPVILTRLLWLKARRRLEVQGG